MKTLLTITLISSTLLLASCTSDTTSPTASKSTTSKWDSHDHSSSGGHSVSSEEWFIIGMIPHHQEAVDTSKIILEKSTSRELKAIATKIVTAQEKEITQMKGWLKDWYPNSILKAEYMPMMQDLSKLSGHDLEDAFIADMIKHHEGAIAMAKEVLEISQRPEIVSIAKNIISTQKAEIAVFQKMMAHH